MLRDLVIDALRHVHGDLVEPLEASPEASTRVLDGRLHRLEELDTPQGTLVRFDLELRLRDGAGREVWSDTLSGETPVDDEPEVEDVARAMSRALVSALRATALPLTAEPAP
jgi:hypothetical protein